MDEVQHGRPLAIDRSARIATPAIAFIARPQGTPAYMADLLSAGIKDIFSLEFFIAEGHPRGVEELARQAFEAQLRILGPQHTDTFATLQHLGIASVSSHRYDEAKKLFATPVEA